MNVIRFYFIFITTLISLVALGKSASETLNSTPVFTHAFKYGNSSIKIKIHNNSLSHLSAEAEKIVRTTFYFAEQLFGGPQKTSKHLDIHLDSDYWGGEADPGWIVLGVNDKKVFGLINWQTILIHELLHLWSGESFRYASEREQWFNEGCTEYYAIKFALRQNILPLNNHSLAMLSPISNYLTAKNAGRVSLTGAAKTSSSKKENYFLIYHGGFSICMALDLEIRRSTGNKRSLDDVMKYLFTHFDRKNRYSTENIEQTAKKFGFSDTKFFNKYVRGAEILRMSQFLNRKELFLAEEKNGKGVPAERFHILSDVFELRGR